MITRKPTRRQIMKNTAGVMVTVTSAGALHAAVATPDSAEGPFYPTKAMRFADIDNDLIKIAGAVREAGGEIFRLFGQVRDRQGAPVAGARVEIWQVDVNARYLHTGDRGGKPRDSAFQGFGHDVTDDQGFYAFRTIKPVPYPGRAPHIHVKVIAAGRTLTTQFYISGDPANAGDALYRRLSAEEREVVEMRFAGSADDLSAQVDIVF